MNPPDRKIVRAFAALTALCLPACASVHPSGRAAMPVFAMDQAHPGVTDAMGAVKRFVCLGAIDEASATAEALDRLRGDAEAKGATALIDYHRQLLAGAPHAPQCPRIVAVEAVAVVLQPGAVQAAAGKLGPG